MSRTLVLSAIALVLMVTLSSPYATRREALANNAQSTAQNLPPGPWTLGIQPTKTIGRIVDVASVSSTLNRGLGVTDFTLHNRSERNVKGVKVAWRLFETSRSNTTLLKGETTKFLAVSLAPKERRVVEYPLVSFAEIYRPLLRGKSKLEGNYRIELWVSDVRFAGNTREQGAAAFLNVKEVNWKGEASISFIAVKNYPPARVDDELGCPHQVCHYDNSQACYKCVDESGGTCGWRDCKSCANGRCPGLID